MIHRRCLYAVLLLGCGLGWLLAGLGGEPVQVRRVEFQQDIAAELQDEVVLFVLPERRLLSYPPQGERRVFGLKGESVFRWHQSRLKEVTSDPDRLRQF